MSMDLCSERRVGLVDMAVRGSLQRPLGRKMPFFTAYEGDSVQSKANGKRLLLQLRPTTEDVVARKQAWQLLLGVMRCVVACRGGRPRMFRLTPERPLP